MSRAIAYDVDGIIGRKLFGFAFIEATDKADCLPPSCGDFTGESLSSAADC